MCSNKQFTDIMNVVFSLNGLERTGWCNMSQRWALDVHSPSTGFRATLYSEICVRGLREFQCKQKCEEIKPKGSLKMARSRKCLLEKNQTFGSKWLDKGKDCNMW